MNTKEKLLWAAIAVVLAGVGYAGYLYLKDAKEETGPTEQTQAPPPEPPKEAGIENPVPGGEGQGAAGKPLPALGASDGEFADALAQLAGQDSLAALLVRESIIRNIVVTVDNLPRAKVAVERRPVKPTPGETRIEGDADAGEVTTLSVQNYARYSPFVKAVGATDTKEVVALYFHWYPLFQKAYEDLGYPDRYFNDRLVAAMDDLLKAPEVEGPVRLVRPRVFFEFADPTLEQRSAGQKLLIRMGLENEVKVKAKLRELRAAIAARKP
ncbi:MAG TPA: DUF3014 domain-containing protein [Steroidobacteraceae bacterium]|nr:DUF3014 domain-containing protein [Steroidobacteraceae bacterium]